MNIWKQFNGLLPKDPLLVATVAAHNADGTSSVTWPGGGQSIVQGQSVAVGVKAFIQGNRVQGPAPALPLYEFEV